MRSFIKIGSGIQMLIGVREIHRYRQHGDRINILYGSKLKIMDYHRNCFTVLRMVLNLFDFKS
jgi:hypothetical protein